MVKTYETQVCYPKESFLAYDLVYFVVVQVVDVDVEVVEYGQNFRVVVVLNNYMMSSERNRGRQVELLVRDMMSNMADLLKILMF